MPGPETAELCGAIADDNAYRQAGGMGDLHERIPRSDSDRAGRTNVVFTACLLYICGGPENAMSRSGNRSGKAGVMQGADLVSRIALFQAAHGS